MGLCMALGAACAVSGAGSKIVRADESGASDTRDTGTSDVTIDEAIAINETTFPDKDFRQYVLNTIDDNHNNVLDDSERANTTSIQVNTLQVRSLKGIEYFYQLETLIAHPGDDEFVTEGSGIGELKELDLRYNPNLLYLDCAYNKIGELDLSQNTKLETLDCQVNNLKALDVTHNPHILGMDCQDNNISTLDISGLINLVGFFCDNNQITYLDFSNAPNVTNIDCRHNQITEIKLGSKPELDYIHCDDNKLTSLDVSGCTVIRWISCCENELTYVDVSCVPTLQVFECGSNKIEYIDVSHNPDLIGLFCYDNLLTALNLGENKNLSHLNAHYNKIDKVNIYSCETLMNTLRDPGTHRELISDVDGDFYAYYTESGMTPVLTVDVNTSVIMRAPKRGEGPSIEDFVERLYTVALGRASEAKGKAYWVDEITSGRRTGGYCAEYFLTGEEFMNRNLSIEDFVETLYKTFFNRASEPNGKAYWVDALKKGTYTKAAVVRGFIDSKEWCNLCADYGVRSGAPTAKAERASKNATDFAKRLYTCCLKRKPEDAGLKYWSLALTNLEQTGAGAAKRFFDSQEFRDLKTSDEEYVSRLYTTFMDREPDQSGFDHWVKALKSGTSRMEVLRSFAASQEFTDICAEYGIERGNI